MRSFSCRTHSIVLSNCSFFYYKDLLIYYIYFTAYEVYFMQKPFHYIIKLFFPLLQRFASLFHLLYILCALFLVEPILWYYQIVLSSTTKIYFFISDISHLLWFITCRIESILLSNCSFVHYKDLLLYYIDFSAYEVYFMQKWFYYIIKLFFPLQQSFATLFHLFTSYDVFFL